MTNEELLAAQKEVETKFNDLTKQKNDIDAELLRLQGEYRAYEQQLKANESSQPEEAEVVNG